MLFPRLVRRLTLAPGQHPEGTPHLSAASGLVRVADQFYVVADDELHLGVFGAHGPVDTPVNLLRAFAGSLPADAKQRKAAKPDLEALALLPPWSLHPHGALLALGSGSRPTREQAVLFSLDTQGKVTGGPTRVDLSALYTPLRCEFPDLNLEGAFVAGDALHLLQRGNRGDGRNACLRYDLQQTLAWLAGTRPEPPALQSQRIVDLGKMGGVPLGLTDGAALSDGNWVFSAVSENTMDSYHDGACVGSVVGVVDAGGQVVAMQSLAGAPKVEGITVQVLGTALQLHMVTDADTPARAACLLEVRWEYALR